MSSVFRLHKIDMGKSMVTTCLQEGMDPVTAFLGIVPVCHPRDKYSWSGAKEIMTFFSKEGNLVPSHSLVYNIKIFSF